MLHSLYNKVFRKASWDEMIIPIVLLPMFTSSVNFNGIEYGMNIKGINERLAAAHNVEKIRKTIIDQPKSRESHSMEKKVSLIPYKIEIDEDDKVEKVGQIILTSSTFTKEDDKEKKCEFEPFSTVVKKFQAVPLTDSEMEQLHIKELKDLIFDKSNPMGILNDFASKTLGESQFNA